MLFFTVVDAVRYTKLEWYNLLVPHDESYLMLRLMALVILMYTAIMVFDRPIALHL